MDGLPEQAAARAAGRRVPERLAEVGERAEALGCRPRQRGRDDRQAHGAHEGQEEHRVDPGGGRRDHGHAAEAAAPEHEAVAGVAQGRDDRRRGDRGDLRGREAGGPVVPEGDEDRAGDPAREQSAHGHERDDVGEQCAAGFGPAGDEHRRRLLHAEAGQARRHQRRDRDERDRAPACGAKLPRQDQHRDEEARVARELRPEEQCRPARDRIRVGPRARAQHGERLCAFA